MYVCMSEIDIEREREKESQRERKVRERGIGGRTQQIHVQYVNHSN